MSSYLYLTSYLKVNSIWIKVLSITAKRIKFVEKSIRDNLSELATSKNF